LLELRGRQVTTTGPSKCDFTSLYVQLSQGTWWDGIYLCSEPRPKDFIDPVNRLDENIKKGIERLEELAKQTKARFEDGRNEYRQEAWWSEWMRCNKSSWMALKVRAVLMICQLVVKNHQVKCISKVIGRR
jgi:hypothetical protein